MRVGTPTMGRADTERAADTAGRPQVEPRKSESEFARADLNLAVGWTGILAGVVSGALIGLFFHRDEWLGGYGSFRRRLMRLGHISFFGIGILNILFGLSRRRVAGEGEPVGVGASLVAAQALMPAVCFLTAWKKPFRHLFFLPVIAVLAPVALAARESWRRE